MPLLQLERNMVEAMRDRSVPELLKWLDAHIEAGVPNDEKVSPPRPFHTPYTPTNPIYA